MAVNKNFVVKNGIEVATNLIVADPINNRVGLGTTAPEALLDVRGPVEIKDGPSQLLLLTLQESRQFVRNLMLELAAHH